MMNPAHAITVIRTTDEYNEDQVSDAYETTAEAIINTLYAYLTDTDRNDVIDWLKGAIIPFDTTIEDLAEALKNDWDL